MTPRSGPLRFYRRDPDGPRMAWDDVRRRLEEALHYWLVVGTTSRPVWGVWLDDALLLSVGSPTLWKRLGPSGAAASAHLESPYDVVIVEGHAVAEHDEAVITGMLEPYNAKYSWNFELGQTGPLVRLDPHVVMAWQTEESPSPEVSNFPLASGRFTFK